MRKEQNPWLIQSDLLRGGGIVDAVAFGSRVYDLLSIHLPLTRKERILEVGCGDGRNAAAFARLGEQFQGNYSAFDIHKKRIQLLQELFQTRPEFSFHHADIFHSYYNPSGETPPEQYRYPYEDRSLDLIFYNSIFSHMALPVIESNLKQARRCLTGTGKVWATMYLLPGTDPSTWTHRFDTRYDEGYTARPDQPEGLVGFDKARVTKSITELGFSVQKFIPGYWSTKRYTLDQHEQDVLVLQKTAKARSE